MFKMMLAELKYNKIIFFIAYGMMLYIFMKTGYEKSNGYGFMVNSSILFFVIVGICVGTAVGENHHRLIALLPLSVKDTAIQNWLFLILIKASIFILWLILYFTQLIRQDPGIIWAMISFSMLNLIVIGLIWIGADLKYYDIRYPNTIFFLFLVGSIFLYIVTVNNIENDIFSKMDIAVPWLVEAYIKFIKWPSGALFMTLLAGAVIYLSYTLSINRKSYLSV
jgi:hypothetical protein